MIAINEAFNDLPIEKQKRIINSALDEFSVNGYKKASTNNIVKKAEISKGMLFYYFNNKKELYIDLIKYGLTFVDNEIFNIVDEAQMDFIEKCKQLSFIKLKTYRENNLIFSFLLGVYLDADAPEEAKEYTDKIVNIRSMLLSKLYANIDTSLFRDDVPPEWIVQLIKWCIVGYENDLTERVKNNSSISEIDYEPYWDEYYSLLDILKTIFYKKGENINGHVRNYQSDKKIW